MFLSLAAGSLVGVGFGCGEIFAAAWVDVWCKPIIFFFYAYEENRLESQTRSPDFSTSTHVVAKKLPHTANADSQKHQSLRSNRFNRGSCPRGRVSVGIVTRCAQQSRVRGVGGVRVLWLGFMQGSNAERKISGPYRNGLV